MQFEGGLIFAVLAPSSLFLDPPHAGVPVADVQNTTMTVRAPPWPPSGQHSIISAVENQISRYPVALTAAGITPQQLGAAMGLYVRPSVRSHRGVLHRIANIAINVWSANTDTLPDDVIDGKPLALHIADFTAMSQRSAWHPASIAHGLAHGGQEWINLVLRGALAAAVIRRHTVENQGRLHMPDVLQELVRP